MITRWVGVVLCLIMVVGSLCCTLERNRYRNYSMRRDIDSMVDDVDWTLGLDEKSSLYESSFPPYR